MFDIEFDRVLSIGINYVGSNCELNGCINDVINLKKQLKTKSHVVLTELSQDSKLIPTRQNIINAIKEFVSGAKSGDKMLFQYSGHGSYTLDRSGDEADRRDETICPLDYSKSGDIVDDELRKIMVEALPEGVSLFCIFDCCHSGTVLDLRYNYRIFPRGDNKREFTIHTDNHYEKSKCRVVCFSGCNDGQTSADAYIKGTYQGAMTWGIIKSISDLNAKGKPVNYKNIMKNLLVLMKNKGYTQIPQISAGHFLNLEDNLWT